MADDKTVDEQLNEALAENSLLKVENDSLKATIEQLETAAAKCTCKKAVAKSAEPFTIGDKEYKWVGPAGFVFEGKRYSAEEAITDEELIGKLLELPGQTLVQELE